MRCTNCKFFDEVNGWGRCRRYAPRPSATTDNFIWPAVGADDWCGDFELTQDRVAIGEKSAQQANAADATIKVFSEVDLFAFNES